MGKDKTSYKISLAAWAPFIGGAEIALERLALGLNEAGYEVCLLVGTKGEALERFQDAGLRCHVVEQRFTDKRHFFKYRKSRLQVQEVLRRENPDLVHSNDLPTHQLISDAALRLNIPRICHHRWIFEGKAIDWLNKFGAERHLFVSKALMDQLCAESSKLSASSRAVVYDGLPLPDEPSEEDRQRSKSKYGIGEKMMVLFAGQIIERKGIADLLHGWTMLPADLTQGTELCIVGDDLENKGEYREKMEKLASELEVSARFLGFQKNVETWLTVADIVMVPSHAEPLGNATLEAMALARPVIGGDVGGIPEMVVHGETGLLIPPKSPRKLAEALEYLLRNAEVRASLGKAARKRCEKMFSIQAHVQQIVKQYQSISQD